MPIHNQYEVDSTRNHQMYSNTSYLQCILYVLHVIPLPFVQQFRNTSVEWSRSMVDSPLLQPGGGSAAEYKDCSEPTHTKSLKITGPAALFVKYPCGYTWVANGEK